MYFELISTRLFLGWDKESLCLRDRSHHSIRDESCQEQAYPCYRLETFFSSRLKGLPLVELLSAIMGSPLGLRAHMELLEGSHVEEFLSL